MPNTATLIAATPLRQVYQLVGDGTVSGPEIANATLQANAPAGPLKQALDQVAADQAAARRAMLAGFPVRCTVVLLATGVDVTAEKNQVTVDAAQDAGASNKPKLVCGMSDTTGQIAFLTVEFVKGENR